MKTISLENIHTSIASNSLVKELIEKVGENDLIINIAYTDYGGTFFDKIVIAYFNKFHPENIISEKTSWNGENAFIFGVLAKELNEETKKYPLGFEDIEDFYFEMEYEMVRETATDICRDMEIGDIDVVIDYLSNYGNTEPNYIDYDEFDLKEYLNREGIQIVG